MAIIDLAIDMGSTNTTIFQYGYGIVLKEPTVIALRQMRKTELIATGAKAKRLYGKVSGNTQVISPIRDGVIINTEAMIILMKDFLSRITPESFLKPRIRALCSTPCGLSIAERKQYETVLQKSGINEVTLIDTPIAVSRLIPNNGIIMVSGGCITDVAMVTNNDIIDGVSLNIAGEAINNAIIDHLYDKHNVRIAQATTEKIKLEIASLYSNDTANIDVIGRDVDTGAQKSFVVTASEIYSVISPILKKLTDVITSMISYAPTEVADEVSANGIFLCGGTSQLPGISEWIANETGLKVTLLEDASSTVISALGLLTGEREKVANLLNLKKF